ncbi:nucleotide-binding protein [Candidatus Micrarchaeota archaeon]|nr:nucleotide-binding protein [Candidatus Micrarchaeota archaeon]
MPPKIIILDTNFLLVPFQFKINIFKELEQMLEVSHKFAISSQTISELKKIGKGKGKNGIAARLALRILETNPIEIIKNDAAVDDWIVNYSKETNAIVCTNDTNLRRRLKSHRIKIVTMKSKSSLGFV